MSKALCSQIFTKKDKYAAVLVNTKGKMVKAKDGSGVDGVRKKMLFFDFEIPVTAKIKGRIDPRLGPLIPLDGNKEGAEKEVPMFNSMNPEKDERVCIIQVFSKQNFNKDASPVWERGGAGEDSHAKVRLHQIVVRNNKSILKVKVETHFCDTAWAWAGAALDGAECVLLITPLQQELPLDGEEEDKKGKKDEQGSLLDDPKDPGEKIADKKAKETADKK